MKDLISRLFFSIVGSTESKLANYSLFLRCLSFPQRQYLQKAVPAAQKRRKELKNFKSRNTY